MNDRVDLIFFSSQTLAKKNSLLELELLKLMLLTYNEQIKLEREKYIRGLGILSTPLNFIPSLVEKNLRNRSGFLVTKEGRR